MVIFVQVSQDDKIFAEISSTEAGLYKALSKKVRKALSRNDQQKNSERIYVIEKLLG